MSTDRPDAPRPGMAAPVQPQPLHTTRPTAPAAPAAQDAQQRPADAGREVAGHARSELEDVTTHAVEEAKSVAETARSEVRDVVDEARDAVREQADRQSRVAADALGRFRDDLQAMARNEAPRDSTAEYLQRAASSLDGVIGRLEREGVEGALSGVRSFARRSPGSFLLASAGAGFALGRILRNGDHPQQVQEQRSTSDRTTPAATRDREIDLTGDTRERPLSAAAAPHRSYSDQGVR